MTPASPLRVLLADDEAAMLDLVQEAVEALGMRVVGRATNGEAAVALAGELRPEVVVLDISMPELDGLAAAARIQAECPTPAVILSSHESPGDLDRAQAAGVGAFLIKPPRGPELDRAIRIAVARHADLMELRRLNAELRKALAEIKTLSGLLPICSACKKVRDDAGYWNQIETFIAVRTTAQFTHSLCPECLPKYFPGVSYDSLGLERRER